MSADNGIYILKSEGPEFRVVHAQAIENINWNEQTKSCCDPHYFNMEEVRRYFGKCKVFSNQVDADVEAVKLADEILGDTMCPILEYGISMIYLPCKFPGTTTLYEILRGRTIENVYDGRTDGSVLIRLNDRTEIVIKEGVIILEEEVIKITSGQTE